MRHDQATRRTLGPEPDERDAPQAASLHRKAKNLLVDGVHREVHRPVRELQFPPSAQVNFLKVFANGDGQQVANGVVGLANQGMIDNSTLLRARVVYIVLSAKVFNDLARIKRQMNL